MNGEINYSQACARCGRTCTQGFRFAWKDPIKTNLFVDIKICDICLDFASNYVKKVKNNPKKEEN